MARVVLMEGIFKFYQFKLRWIAKDRIDQIYAKCSVYYRVCFNYIWGFDHFGLLKTTLISAVGDRAFNCFHHPFNAGLPNSSNLQ